MGYATHLGPVRFGTVKDGVGANCGSPILSQVGVLGFADAGAAKQIAVLPAGSQITSIIIDVATAFAGSGTDLIDIGTAANAALFVNDADVATAGHFTATLVAANLASMVNVGAVDVPVIATYVGSVVDAAAGSAYITINYLLKNPDGTTTPTP